MCFASSFDLYSPEDTIVAVATPPGRGGLAVVRLSGPRAVAIARGLIEGGPALEPRKATFVTVAIDSSPERPSVACLPPGCPRAANPVSKREDAGVGSRVLRDQAVVTWFAGPASYTGEDVVEISLHGSPLVAGRVVTAAVNRGARPARAGEFTLRAFLNGKLDLAQAEAVEDLVAATTEAQARAAYDQLQGTLSERIRGIEEALFGLSARLEASVDFPEEGYQFVDVGEVAETLRAIEGQMGALLEGSRRGRLLREGATVAIVGRTNVGKSTVFNRLAGSERAIVTEIPGTTRDLLTERIDLGGVPVTVVDTAGTRETNDPVEREGVNRALRAREAADLVLVVLDGSTPLEAGDESLLRETTAKRRIVVVNKRDLPGKLVLSNVPAGEVVRISALQDDGVEELAAAIGTALIGGRGGEAVTLTNLRHIEALTRARAGLQEALASAERGIGRGEIGQTPEEFILSDIQASRTALEEITGRRTTDDLLNAIFSRFCIGK